MEIKSLFLYTIINARFTSRPITENNLFSILQNKKKTCLQFLCKNKIAINEQG